MPYVDYAAVRRLVSMRDVLGLIGWHPRTTSGAQWRGRCPLDPHATSAMRQRDVVFSVNVQTGLYRCFKCAQKGLDVGGNQLDLYARVKHLTVYAAALDLLARCGHEPPRRSPASP